MKINHKIILFFIFCSLIAMAQPRRIFLSPPKKPPNLSPLEKLFIAEMGNVFGYFVGEKIVASLDQTGLISFPDRLAERKTAFHGATFSGAVFSSIFLNYATHSRESTFAKSALVSTMPLFLYIAIKNPKFKAIGFLGKEVVLEDMSYFLTSILIVPLVNVVANSFLEQHPHPSQSVQKQNNKRRQLQVRALGRIMIARESYSIELVRMNF